MIFKRILQGAVWGLALLSVLTYVRVSLMRLAYPLELDCIEGVIMDHVVRLSQGQPIYVAPTLRFIPLAYMPLLMVVSSWITHFFEPAFWHVRIVSFGATVGLMALIGTVIRAETRSWTRPGRVKRVSGVSRSSAGQSSAWSRSTVLCRSSARHV